MKPARRRSTFLVGLAVLVALLVGGRWLAIETAERAWAASLGGAVGDVYLGTRDLARLVRGMALLIAIVWGVANLYYVYRAIGSVQLPRRLGDLEIVEAVPQRVLLAATLASGLIYGLLLNVGTGHWWIRELLASKPPHFGVLDPVLHRDIGYYLGELPWLVTWKNFALLAAASGAIVVGLLYLGIGSLRFNNWHPTTSPHARGHLGLLLAVLALALARGAALDPAEVVAGLHGSVDRGALEVRVPAAVLIEALSVMAALVSLVWGLRDKPRLLMASWVALLLTLFGARVVFPGVVRGSPSVGETNRDQFERLAYGADWREESLPHGFTSVSEAVTQLPVWDPERVAAVARRSPFWHPQAPVAGEMLVPPGPEDRRAHWLIAPAPVASGPASEGPGTVDGGTATASGLDWGDVHRGVRARAGRALVAIEADSGLVVRPAETRDSVFWLGPGFREFAVAAPDTWPGVQAGVSLAGWWRRVALAWVLQSPELARAETDGLVLLWRRDVADRLRRLAPFATFDAAAPLVADSTLWWISYGYLDSDLFPLVRPLEWPGSDVSVRYLRAGLVGVVNAASGTTYLYLAPGADSLAAAWSQLLAPLFRPLHSLPAGIRDQLSYPRQTFRLAAEQLVRSQTDSSPWHARPREPYELVAPADSGVRGLSHLWTAQGFESGSPPHFAGLLAATTLPAGPRLYLWKPITPLRLPAELLGSPETAPGVMRMWTGEGELLTEQGLFVQPATNGPVKGLSQVYLTRGARVGNGPTPTAALRNLLTSGAHPTSGDTSLAARWESVRRLASEADAALAAGDLEAFGRLYRELKHLIGVGRALAPPRERR